MQHFPYQIAKPMKYVSFSMDCCDVHIIIIPIFQALSSAETTVEHQQLICFPFVSDERKHEHNKTPKKQFFPLLLLIYIFPVIFFEQNLIMCNLQENWTHRIFYSVLVLLHVCRSQTLKNSKLNSKCCETSTTID